MTDNTALLAIVTPQINREESFRRNAYLDSNGIATIGFGRADSGVRMGMFCTLEEAEGWRDAKLNSLCAELDKALPWWRTLNLPRQAVLLEMAYQMGTAGLLLFKNTLKAVQSGNWVVAQAGMLSSKWGTQDSPERASREALQMLTGAVQ